MAKSKNKFDLLGDLEILGNHQKEYNIYKKAYDDGSLLDEALKSEIGMVGAEEFEKAFLATRSTTPSGGSDPLVDTQNSGKSDSIGSQIEAKWGSPEDEKLAREYEDSLNKQKEAERYAPKSEIEAATMEGLQDSSKIKKYKDDKTRLEELEKKTYTGIFKEETEGVQRMLGVNFKDKDRGILKKAYDDVVGGVLAPLGALAGGGVIKGAAMLGLTERGNMSEREASEYDYLKSKVNSMELPAKKAYLKKVEGEELQAFQQAGFINREDVRNQYQQASGAYWDKRRSEGATDKEIYTELDELNDIGYMYDKSKDLVKMGMRDMKWGTALYEGMIKDAGDKVTFGLSGISAKVKAAKIFDKVANKEELTPTEQMFANAFITGTETTEKGVMDDSNYDLGDSVAHSAVFMGELGVTGGLAGAGAGLLRNGVASLGKGFASSALNTAINVGEYLGTAALQPSTYGHALDKMNTQAQKGDKENPFLVTDGDKLNYAKNTKATISDLKAKVNKKLKELEEAQINDPEGDHSKLFQEIDKLQQQRYGLEDKLASVVDEDGEVIKSQVSLGKALAAGFWNNIVENYSERIIGGKVDDLTQSAKKAIGANKTLNRVADKTGLNYIADKAGKVNDKLQRTRVNLDRSITGSDLGLLSKSFVRGTSGAKLFHSLPSEMVEEIFVQLTPKIEEDYAKSLEELTSSDFYTQVALSTLLLGGGGQIVGNAKNGIYYLASEDYRRGVKAQSMELNRARDFYKKLDTAVTDKEVAEEIAMNTVGTVFQYNEYQNKINDLRDLEKPDPLNRNPKEREEAAKQLEKTSLYNMAYQAASLGSEKEFKSALKSLQSKEDISEEMKANAQEAIGIVDNFVDMRNSYQGYVNSSSLYNYDTNAKMFERTARLLEQKADNLGVEEQFEKIEQEYRDTQGYDDSYKILGITREQAISDENSQKYIAGFQNFVKDENIKKYVEYKFNAAQALKEAEKSKEKLAWELDPKNAVEIKKREDALKQKMIDAAKSAEEARKLLEETKLKNEAEQLYKINQRAVEESTKVFQNSKLEHYQNAANVSNKLKSIFSNKSVVPQETISGSLTLLNDTANQTQMVNEAQGIESPKSEDIPENINSVINRRFFDSISNIESDDTDRMYVENKEYVDEQVKELVDYFKSIEGKESLTADEKTSFVNAIIVNKGVVPVGLTDLYLKHQVDIDWSYQEARGMYEKIHAVEKAMQEFRNTHTTPSKIYNQSKIEARADKKSIYYKASKIVDKYKGPEYSIKATSKNGKALIDLGVTPNEKGIITRAELEPFVRESLKSIYKPLFEKETKKIIKKEDYQKAITKFLESIAEIKTNHTPSLADSIKDSIQDKMSEVTPEVVEEAKKEKKEEVEQTLNNPETLSEKQEEVLDTLIEEEITEEVKTIAEEEIASEETTEETDVPEVATNNYIKSKFKQFLKGKYIGKLSSFFGKLKTKFRQILLGITIVSSLGSIAIGNFTMSEYMQLSENFSERHVTVKEEVKFSDIKIDKKATTLEDGIGTVKMPYKDGFTSNQVINLSNNTFEIRERDNTTPVENAVGITTNVFKPFQTPSQFKGVLPRKSDEVKQNPPVIAYNLKTGKLKVGNLKDFNDAWKVSETYTIELDFKLDKNGKVKTVYHDQAMRNVPITMSEGNEVPFPIGVDVKDDTIDPTAHNTFGALEGGKVILEVDGYQVQINGGFADIYNAWKQLKDTHPNAKITAYLLDNGSYNLPILKDNGIVTDKDLKSHTMRNRDGGTSLILKKDNTSEVDATYKHGIEKIQTDNYRKDENGLKIENNPSVIVLHHTGEFKNGEQGTLDLFTKKGGDSAHFVIGKDGKLYQLNDTSYVLFHAGKSEFNGKGDLNSHSIGIEIQGDSNKSDFTKEQYETLITLVNNLSKQHGIEFKNITDHKTIRDNYIAANPEDKEVHHKHDMNEEVMKLLIAEIQKVYDQYENVENVVSQGEPVEDGLPLSVYLGLLAALQGISLGVSKYRKNNKGKKEKKESDNKIEDVKEKIEEAKKFVASLSLAPQQQSLEQEVAKEENLTEEVTEEEIEENEDVDAVEEQNEEIEEEEKPTIKKRKLVKTQEAIPKKRGFVNQMHRKDSVASVEDIPESPILEEVVEEKSEKPKRKFVNQQKVSNKVSKNMKDELYAIPRNPSSDIQNKFIAQMASDIENNVLPNYPHIDLDTYITSLVSALGSTKVVEQNYELIVEAFETAKKMKLPQGTIDHVYKMQFNPIAGMVNLSVFGLATGIDNSSETQVVPTPVEIKKEETRTEVKEEPRIDGTLKEVKLAPHTARLYAGIGLKFGGVLGRNYTGKGYNKVDTDSNEINEEAKPFMDWRNFSVGTPIELKFNIEYATNPNSITSVWENTDYLNIDEKSKKPTRVRLTMKERLFTGKGKIEPIFKDHPTIKTWEDYVAELEKFKADPKSTDIFNNEELLKIMPIGTVNNGFVGPQEDGTVVDLIPGALNDYDWFNNSNVALMVTEDGTPLLSEREERIEKNKDFNLKARLAIAFNGSLNTSIETFKDAATNTLPLKTEKELEQGYSDTFQSIFSQFNKNVEEFTKNAGLAFLNNKFTLIGSNKKGSKEGEPLVINGQKIKRSSIVNWKEFTQSIKDSGHTNGRTVLVHESGKDIDGKPLYTIRNVITNHQGKQGQFKSLNDLVNTLYYKLIDTANDSVAQREKKAKLRSLFKSRFGYEFSQASKDLIGLAYPHINEKASEEEYRSDFVAKALNLKEIPDLGAYLTKEKSIESFIEDLQNDSVIKTTPLEVMLRGIHTNVVFTAIEKDGENIYTAGSQPVGMLNSDSLEIIELPKIQKKESDSEIESGIINPDGDTNFEAEKDKLELLDADINRITKKIAFNEKDLETILRDQGENETTAPILDATRKEIEELQIQLEQLQKDRETLVGVTGGQIGGAVPTETLELQLDTKINNVSAILEEDLELTALAEEVLDLDEEVKDQFQENFTNFVDNFVDLNFNWLVKNLEDLGEIEKECN